VKILLTGLFSLYISTNALAQRSDSTKEMSEVIITGFHTSRIMATSLNIEPYPIKELEKKSPYNLSDALAKIPGVSQMTTGGSISKPVIRGLYGNRILVLLSGLRFDNQQFQDEHGLGLSQIGIEKVEVIKGPASLLYGTDAIGGVINVIEETPKQEGEKLDVNLRLYSNTLGTLTDAGYSNYRKNKWWRLRLGAESNADYTDGNNLRVLNSRNGGYYLKAGFGFNKKHWIQNNAYNFSYNQYGFIMDSLTKLYVHDDRFSRSMAGPHHNVMLNILSSQNTFLLKKSTLKLNAGIQSNKRAEDEGSGEISLNMHLLSALENAKWEKNLNKNLLFVLNQQFTYEHNTNLGKRILIPDANMLEGNLSAFSRYHFPKINIELGAGYNYKQIVTFKTKSLNSGDVNTPDTSIHPFNTGRASVNGMFGFSYTPNNHINVKTNISSGNRAANLAELSSNGLHEGTYRAEIGNPDLKMEQNINAASEIEIDRRYFFISASGYYNRFFNYIYLTAVNEPSWLGFAKYRYTQKDAALYGGELTCIAKPGRQIEVKETFSATEGILDEGGYLPFIPANKLLSSIKYEKNLTKKLKGFYLEPELEYVFPQNHPAQFETPTADYALVHLHTGITTVFYHNSIKWNLSCRNILNKAYADHLSRLKYYGYYNQGINFVLSVSTVFD
jgi:iron complex outermembrane receptor protein